MLAVTPPEETVTVWAPLGAEETAGAGAEVVVDTVWLVPVD